MVSPLPIRKVYSHLPTMRAHLLAKAAQLEAASPGSANGLSAWLNKRGTSDSHQGRIGGLVYRNGTLRPLDAWQLDLVSATPIGVIASGAGTSYTLASSPLTLPAGASVVQAWSMSTGLVGGQVALTRDGLDVDLAAARTLVAGDLLLDVRRCELRLGTDWAPEGAGGAYFSGSGLVRVPGTGRAQVLFPTLAASADGSPDFVSVSALLDIVESSAGASSYYGVGTLSDDKMAVSAQHNTGGVWQRAAVFGARSGPTSQTGSATGTPGTKTGVRVTYTARPSTTGNYQYTASVRYAGITDGLMQTALQNAQNLGLGADGPIDGLCVAWDVTSGSLGLTVRELEATIR